MKSTKGHGYFRKSKAYGLIAAIALSGALFVSNGTSLAEETTVTPKTEAVADLGEVPHVPSEELAPGVAYDKNIYTLLDPELKAIADSARDNRVGLFRKAVINKGKVTTKEELEKVLNEIKEEQKVVKEQIERALPIQIKRNETYDKALNAYNDYYNFVKEEAANGNIQKITATAWPETYPKDLTLINETIADQATSYKKDLERRIEQYKQDKKSYYIDEIQDFNKKVETQLGELKEELKNNKVHGNDFLNSIRGNKENDAITGLVSFKTVNFSSFEDFSKIEKDNTKALEEARAYADVVHKLYEELTEIERLYDVNNNTQSENDYISFLSKGNIIEEEKEVTNLEEANKIFEANKNILLELNRNPKQTLTFYKMKLNPEKFKSSLDPKKGFKITKLLQPRVVDKPGASPVLKPKNTHEKVFFNDYVITYALPASETDSTPDIPVEEKPNTDKPVEDKPNTDEPVEGEPSTENKTTTTAKKQILPTNNQIVKNSEKATPTKTPTTSTTIGIGLGLTASSILTMLGLAKRKKD